MIGFSWDDVTLSRFWECSHFPQPHLYPRSSFLVIFSLRASWPSGWARALEFPNPLGRQVHLFSSPNTPSTMNCPSFTQGVESHILLGLSSYLKQSWAEEILRDYRTCFTSRRFRVGIPISLIKAWLCWISIYNLSIQGPGDPLRITASLPTTSASLHTRAPAHAHTDHIDCYSFETFSFDRHRL